MLGWSATLRRLTVSLSDLLHCLLKPHVLIGTGHPAMTLPVGFVPARDDDKVRLPAGLQIVGKKFADIHCLKVGAAWEKAYDWKKQ